MAKPDRLEASAVAPQLGDAAFIQYRPDRLSGNNGPYNPAVDS